MLTVVSLPILVPAAAGSSLNPAEFCWWNIYRRPPGQPLPSPPLPFPISPSFPFHSAGEVRRWHFSPEIAHVYRQIVSIGGSWARSASNEHQFGAQTAIWKENNPLTSMLLNQQLLCLTHHKAPEAFKESEQLKMQHSNTQTMLHMYYEPFL